MAKLDRIDDNRKNNSSSGAVRPAEKHANGYRKYHCFTFSGGGFMVTPSELRAQGMAHA